MAALPSLSYNTLWILDLMSAYFLPVVRHTTSKQNSSNIHMKRHRDRPLLQKIIGNIIMLVNFGFYKCIYNKIEISNYLPINSATSNMSETFGCGSAALSNSQTNWRYKDNPLTGVFAGKGSLEELAWFRLKWFLLHKVLLSPTCFGRSFVLPPLTYFDLTEQHNLVSGVTPWILTS